MDDDPSEPPEVRLQDLRPLTPKVHVVARVVSLQRREVARRSDGARQSVLSGRLSDGTGTVRFSWWDPPRDGVERGTILRAVGAEVREFRGRPELVFSWKTRIAPAGPAELPRVDDASLPRPTVRELREGSEGFRLDARILSVTAKPVSVGEERRVVYDGRLADRTGAIAFSSWSDFGLVAGATVAVAGGYVRAFRGRRQLVLDEGSRVSRIPPDGLPELAELARRPPRTIAELEAERGGELAAIEGLVVGLVPPSGLVHRCAACRRLVTSGLCRVHGQVVGVPDLRARLVLDDGTGAATIDAGRSETERLWGTTLDQVRDRLREVSDPAVLEEQLAEALVGRRFVVRGSASCDDFGLTVIPESIETAEIDLDAAAVDLAGRLAREP
jgi:replication factor A1